jgi:purine-binding chemotaxis protein CheW
MDFSEDEFSNSFDTDINQFLLFLLNDELYAIEALNAREIVEYGHITKVPMMQSFVKGVTNIRGNIVPVVDLFDRFGLGASKIGEKTSIIVVNCSFGEKKTEIGIMIDEAYEVDTIDDSKIKKTPDFGTKVDTRFIKSMGKYNNGYIPILDTEAILNIEELSMLQT